MSDERIDVRRTVTADPATVFRVLRDPQGHVAIDSSGMLMSATGDPVTAVGDEFVVHMDRESLGDRPMGRYDVTVKKSWVQSAFGTGDVYLGAGAEKPLVMRDIRNADLVQEVLHDLMEDVPPAIRSRRMGPRTPESYGSTSSAVSDETPLWNRR